MRQEEGEGPNGRRASAGPRAEGAPAVAREFTGSILDDGRFAAVRRIFDFVHELDAIVFTGGIGENRAAFRARVCADLEQLGIALDPAANAAARGETNISAASSRVEVWVVPTNEEIVVARLARQLLEG